MSAPTDDRPSIAKLQLTIAAPHGSPPARLTDAELTAQHAGYHEFNAIESMVCELRERRRHQTMLDAAPMLLEIAATGLAWATAEDALSSAPPGVPRILAASRATEAFDKHRAALAKVRP